MVDASLHCGNISLESEIVGCKDQSEATIANVICAEKEENIIDGFAINTFLTLKDLKIYVSKLEPPRPYETDVLLSGKKRKITTHSNRRRRTVNDEVLSSNNDPSLSHDDDHLRQNSSQIERSSHDDNTVPPKEQDGDAQDTQENTTAVSEDIANAKESNSPAEQTATNGTEHSLAVDDQGEKQDETAVKVEMEEENKTSTENTADDVPDNKAINEKVTSVHESQVSAENNAPVSEIKASDFLSRLLALAASGQFSAPSGHTLPITSVSQANNSAISTAAVSHILFPKALDSTSTISKETSNSLAPNFAALAQSPFAQRLLFGQSVTPNLPGINNSSGSSTTAGVKRPYQSITADETSKSSTKRGKWCTAHVRIAWLIYQKQHPNAAADPSKHLQQAKERATPAGAANEGTAASKRPSVIQETRPVMAAGVNDKKMEQLIPSAFLSLVSPATHKNAILQSAAAAAAAASSTSDKTAALKNSISSLVERTVNAEKLQSRSPQLATNPQLWSQQLIAASRREAPKPTNIFGHGSLEDFAARQQTPAHSIGGDAPSTAAFLQLQQQINMENKRRQMNDSLLLQNGSNAARAAQAFAHSVESLISGQSISRPPQLQQQQQQQPHLPPPPLRTPQLPSTSSTQPNFLDNMMRLIGQSQPPVPRLNLGDRAGPRPPPPFSQHQQPQPQHRPMSMPIERPGLDSSPLAPFFAAALASSVNSGHPRMQPPSFPGLPATSRMPMAPPGLPQLPRDSLPNVSSALQMHFGNILNNLPGNPGNPTLPGFPSGNLPGSQLPQNSFLFPSFPRR